MLKKVLMASVIAVILIAVYFFLKNERSVYFTKIGQFSWIEDISFENAPFGTLWWGLTENPDSYISIDEFDNLYCKATNHHLIDDYQLDFEKHTYIIVMGYELEELSYNLIDQWGKLTAKYPWYHGRVVIKRNGSPKQINIYEIPNMRITSDEHSRGSTMDNRIIIR